MTPDRWLAHGSFTTFPAKCHALTCGREVTSQMCIRGAASLSLMEA